jgi:hypothetical protein
MSSDERPFELGGRVVKAVMTNTPHDPDRTSPELRNVRVRSGKEAWELLTRLADALNACEKAGLLVGLADGAAITNEGYVLPVGGAGECTMIGERWVARTRDLAKFPVDERS